MQKNISKLLVIFILLVYQLALLYIEIKIVGKIKEIEKK